MAGKRGKQTWTKWQDWKQGDDWYKAGRRARPWTDRPYAKCPNKLCTNWHYCDKETGLSKYPTCNKCGTAYLDFSPKADVTVVPLSAQVAAITSVMAGLSEGQYSKMPLLQQTRKFLNELIKDNKDDMDDEPDVPVVPLDRGVEFNISQKKGIALAKQIEKLENAAKQLSVQLIAAKQKVEDLLLQDKEKKDLLEKTRKEYLEHQEAHSALEPVGILNAKPKPKVATAEQGEAAGDHAKTMKLQIKQMKLKLKHLCKEWGDADSASETDSRKSKSGNVTPTYAQMTEGMDIDDCDDNMCLEELEKRDLLNEQLNERLQAEALRVQQEAAVQQARIQSEMDQKVAGIIDKQEQIVKRRAVLKPKMVKKRSQKPPATLEQAAELKERAETAAKEAAARTAHKIALDAAIEEDLRILNSGS